MDVWLYQKLIYRHDTPDNRELDHHIIKMERKLICQMQVSGDWMPQVGDVHYVNKIPYEIKRRIFITDQSGFNVNGCVCEVVVYNANYTTSYGSDSWREMIPLVTEIPDEVLETLEVKKDTPSDESGMQGESIC